MLLASEYRIKPPLWLALVFVFDLLGIAISSPMLLGASSSRGLRYGLTHRH